jgi:hypothetical protein
LNLSIEPVDDSRPEWPAVTALLSAAFAAVIVFLPPEGRIATPLHNAVWALLGRVTFMVPLGVAFVGVLLGIRRARPSVALPRRRLVGVGVMLLAILPMEQLLERSGDGTGLVGQWLSASLLDLLGGVATALLLIVLLGVGTCMAFNLSLITLRRALQHPHAGG